MTMYDAPSDRDYAEYLNPSEPEAEPENEMPYYADALFCVCGHHRSAHQCASGACKFCGGCKKYKPRHHVDHLKENKPCPF